MRLLSKMQWILKPDVFQYTLIDFFFSIHNNHKKVYSYNSNQLLSAVLTSNVVKYALLLYFRSVLKDLLYYNTNNEQVSTRSIMNTCKVWITDHSRSGTFSNIRVCLLTVTMSANYLILFEKLEASTVSFTSEQGKFFFRSLSPGIQLLTQR